MKKPYWIKYKINFGWNSFDSPLDWTLTNRYKTERARNDALADMKRKGHKIISTDQLKWRFRAMEIMCDTQGRIATNDEIAELEEG